jgi:hypothetical protein
MKTAVIGVTDTQVIDEAIRSSGYSVTEIISGEAGSPIEEYAAHRNLRVRRSDHVLDRAEALVAVWDGGCPWVRRLIEQGKQMQRLVFVYRVPGGTHE